MSFIKQQAGFFGALVLSSALTLGIYYPCISSFFLADDYLWLEPVSFERVLEFFYSSWGYERAYRPIMRFVFYFDRILFGWNPVGWHVGNLALHSLNGVLLWMLVRRFTSSISAPWLVLVLFISSPLVHENVAWISGRTHLLSGFFYLLALHYFINSLLRSGIVQTPFVLALVCLVLGLGTYESVFSFPLIAVLAAGYFVIDGRTKVDNAAAKCITVTLVTIAAFCLRSWVLGDYVGAVNFHHANFLHGWIFNLRLLFVLLSETCPEIPIMALLIGMGIVHNIKERERERVSLRHIFHANFFLCPLPSILDCNGGCIPVSLPRGHGLRRPSSHRY